ncbi:MAG: type I-A CRISPR-associated protein Cas5a [Candidatus Caldarchaeum sp.]|uniref:Type I-A CRISPR-associated protein Cas5 n=1 Tax=Caldiarchaeum subterraneum TaxID=311458 RepID=A0A7C5Y3Z0_CALS0
MKYLRIDAEVHWGLLINYHAFTKSRPALRTVPPTTVIGALAQPLALIKKWPETDRENSTADKIRNFFKGVYVGQNLSLSEYSDLSKIFSYDADEKQILTDAAAVSKIYCGPVADDVSLINLVLLIDEEAARNVLGNSWIAELVSSAWAVSRIGARESVVSVRNVELGDVNQVRADEAVTKYCFPLSSGQPLDGDYLVANVVDWRSSSIGDYVAKPTVQLVVPYSMRLRKITEVKVKPTAGYVYKAGDEVVIPW